LAKKKETKLRTGVRHKTCCIRYTT